MDKSFLVRLLGFPATLIHGDPLQLGRWLWLRRRLPRTKNGEKLIDVGCGSGAFTIGSALRGYESVGLSWDHRNQQVASERAEFCRLCLENIEHILDDRKLMRDIHACLRPGGFLLLTSAISKWPRYSACSSSRRTRGRVRRRRAEFVQRLLQPEDHHRHAPLAPIGAPCVGRETAASHIAPASRSFDRATDGTARLLDLPRRLQTAFHGNEYGGRIDARVILP
jgi:SAM-dependent methyltransferase